MKRREFLQTSGLGCVLTLAKPAWANSIEEHSPEHSSWAPKEFELDELAISDLQEGLKSGKFTARSLVKKYLDRVDDVDKGGPTINSIIELNRDALSVAELL